MKNNLKKITNICFFFMFINNYNMNEAAKEYLARVTLMMATGIVFPLIIKVSEPYISAWSNRRELLNNLKIISPNIKDYNFDFIIGYDHIKDILRKKIKILKKQSQKKTKINGLLLYGPPGNGKTNFVVSLAAEAGIPVILLNINNLMANQQYILENFQTIFDKAKEMSPCILFIDEIDLLVKNRMVHHLSEMQEKILTMILQKLDGLMAQDNAGILFVGCTNNINFIDEAIFRSGRLGQKIFIGFPLESDIEKLFIDRLPDYDKYKNFLLSNNVYHKMHEKKIPVADVLEYIKDLINDIEENNQANRRLNENFNSNSTKNCNDSDNKNNTSKTIDEIIINLNKEFGIQ